jgi:hypothetical protein
MATATEVRQAQEEMLDAAARLVEEVDDAPAGVVLRSYWRAVRFLRHTGCPLPAMAVEADLVARDLLVARGVRVPRPRGTDRELVPLPRGG